MSVEDDQKLFVAGLADAATEEGLRKLFESTGGSVSEVTVPRDRTSGKPRGFAFVTMASEEDARTVRQRLDGSNYEGRPLSVRPFRADRGAPGPAPRPGAPRDSRGESRGFESRSSEHRAYDGGGRGSGYGSSGGGGGYSGSGHSGSGHSGSGQSGSGYSSSGQSGSGHSGSGYAAAGHSGSAQSGSGHSGSGYAAAGGPPGQSGSGTSGAGYPSQGGGGAGDDSTLYVGNLPFDCNSAELEQLLSDRGFAAVRRIHLPMDPEGRARGFGFVSLDSADTARRAVEQLQDLSVRGRRLSISVARARGAPGTGGSGNYPRAGGPPPSAGQRPARPAGGSGSYAAAPHHAAPRYDAPSFGGGAPAPFAGGGGGPDDEARRQGKWAGGGDKDKDKDKKKEKKRKAKGAPAADRGVKKRRDDAFRSTRAQDYVDDWDDD